MRGGYAIADEPEASRLAHLTVRPSMPLLALMLGGAWIAWPWFALNAYAMGSPTRRRELALAIAGFLGGVVLAALVVGLHAGEIIDTRVARYLVIGVIVFKLGGGYVIHALQSRTFAVYEHFGGAVRSGRMVLIGSLIVRVMILVGLGDFWSLVLG